MRNKSSCSVLSVLLLSVTALAGCPEVGESSRSPVSDAGSKGSGAGDGGAGVGSLADDGSSGAGAAGEGVGATGSEGSRGGQEPGGASRGESESRGDAPGGGSGGGEPGSAEGSPGESGDAGRGGGSDSVDGGTKTGAGGGANGQGGAGDQGGEAGGGEMGGAGPRGTSGTPVEGGQPGGPSGPADGSSGEGTGSDVTVYTVPSSWVGRWSGEAGYKVRVRKPGYGPGFVVEDRSVGVIFQIDDFVPEEGAEGYFLLTGRLTATECAVTAAVQASVFAGDSVSRVSAPIISGAGGGIDTTGRNVAVTLNGDRRALTIAGTIAFESEAQPPAPCDGKGLALTLNRAP